MNTRRVLFVLGGLAVLAALAIGGVLFVRSNEALWNPYLRAALEIESAYGQFVDVTYIGPIEQKPEVLAYVVIVVAPFPSQDSPEWVGYDAMVGQVLGSLIEGESSVSYIILLPGPNGPLAVMVAEFDAQALKAGASMTDALRATYPLSGTPEADPYLKWMDK